MNSAETLVKIAVVGAGLIGKRHVSLLHNAPDYSLCAIIDPQDGAKKLAEEVGVPHFHELADFLSSDVDCDGVILATPNETHREFALNCISKGLPCLIEKPLASNSEDALAICEESESSGVAVLVGHHRRHHLVSRALKERLEKETLGKLVGGQLTWMLNKPAEYFANGDWRTKKGGGPIWINLIHEIDLLRYFLGEIIEVSAMVSNAVRGFAVEDTAIINMRCENGAVISAILSDCAPSPWHFEGGSGENPNISETGHGGLRVFGTKGSIEFPSLTEWHHKDENGHWGTPIFSEAHLGDLPMGDEVALTEQMKNFAEVIRGKGQPLVGARDGLQSVRVVEAIHKSASSGSTEQILTA